MLKISFATSVWEKDYRFILGDNDYLETQMIENHNFPFDEKVIIINNVDDIDHAYKLASRKLDSGILTKIFIAKESEKEMLCFFKVQREDFTAYRVNEKGEGLLVNDNWIYYNGLAPLSAIYNCDTEYLLYQTGDSRLDQKIDWIEDAIFMMQKNKQYKVANLNWDNGMGAVFDAYNLERKYLISKKGFSDQLFLVKTEDFKNPIYGTVREDAKHFPWGDTFEKRVFSHMVDQGWERITLGDKFYISKNLY